MLIKRLLLFKKYIMIIIIKAVYQHLNARSKIKTTQGARRKPVASPASKFTIKSCDKQKKSIKEFKNIIKKI